MSSAILVKIIESQLSAFNRLENLVGKKTQVCILVHLKLSTMWVNLYLNHAVGHDESLFSGRAARAPPATCQEAEMWLSFPFQSFLLAEVFPYTELLHGCIDIKQYFQSQVSFHLHTESKP